MASNQKMSKNAIYFGIGLCIFIFIVFILFRGNHKPSYTTTTYNPTIIFPVFPVFPVKPENQLDSFLEYYKNYFEKDASTIYTNYDKFTENYNVLLTSIESEKSMNNILYGFTQLQKLKDQAIENEQEIIKLSDEKVIPIIEQCDKILLYDVKSMDRDRLASLSSEITNIKKNIEEYNRDYQNLNSYFISNDINVESNYKNINELYDTYIKSYNEYYDIEIKPSIILLNSIESKLPNVKDNPLYESNPENMKKVNEVSKFIENFRNNIHDITNPLQENYDIAKNNYKKYKDIYANISNYNEKFKLLVSYIEKLNLLEDIIKTQTEDSQTIDDNMDKLNMFKSKISNFEDNFMKSYNIPYNLPTEEEISSNKYSNIPIL